TRFSRDWSSDVCSSDLGCIFSLVHILPQSYPAAVQAAPDASEDLISKGHNPSSVLSVPRESAQEFPCHRHRRSYRSSLPECTANDPGTCYNRDSWSLSDREHRAP